MDVNWVRGGPREQVCTSRALFSTLRPPFPSRTSVNRLPKERAWDGVFMLSHLCVHERGEKRRDGKRVGGI